MLIRRNTLTYDHRLRRIRLSLGFRATPTSKVESMLYLRGGIVALTQHIDENAILSSRFSVLVLNVSASITCELNQVPGTKLREF